MSLMENATVVILLLPAAKVNVSAPNNPFILIARSCAKAVPSARSHADDSREPDQRLNLVGKTPVQS
jgi:hypothetical protein